jgi:hypothetical protein
MAMPLARELALAPTLEDAAVTFGICISTLWHKRKQHNLD